MKIAVMRSREGNGIRSKGEKLMVSMCVMRDSGVKLEGNMRRRKRVGTWVECW
jgi:hypothetical protein